MSMFTCLTNNFIAACSNGCFGCLDGHGISAYWIHRRAGGTLDARHLSTGSITDANLRCKEGLEKGEKDPSQF